MNTLISEAIILKKGESLKIVLDGRQLNSMIDETKRIWPIEPIQIIFIQIEVPFFSIAVMNSAYIQKQIYKKLQISLFRDNNTVLSACLTVFLLAQPPSHTV